MKNFIRYGVSALGGMFIGVLVSVIAWVDFTPMIQEPIGLIGLYLGTMLVSVTCGTGFGCIWNQWLNKRGWY